MDLFAFDCNDVKVTDLPKARDICDRFEFKGAHFSPDDNGILRYIVDESSDLDLDACWPYAVPVEDMPNEDDFDDESKYWDAVTELFGEKGADGFVSFLQQIAPLLDEPLMFLTVMNDGGVSAAVWYVEPNGKIAGRVAAFD